MIAAICTFKANETIIKYSRKLNHNFHMYIYTQTIDGIILGSLMIGLLLIFRSPHALLLGLILGIVNYIPYFGSIFGTAFAVIVVAFTQGIPTAAVAGVFMFIIQQADGNFIQPKLMGGSFSLSPLLVIISVTIGMHYAGILGMLMAIPIVAILKDLLDEYIEYREYKKLNPSPPPETKIMDRGI
jgi:predicted PurR-regulated permease PerM